MEEEQVASVVDSAVASTGMDYEAEHSTLPTGLPFSSEALSSELEKGCQPVPSDVHDMEYLESEIPGLDSSACNSGLSEPFVASSSALMDVEDASQEQVTSSDQRTQLNVLPSLSADKSEELSPRAAVADVNSLVSSTATSVGLSSHLVLPKMSAPVVILADEEKDQLQKLAFTRIIEAYKQIAIAGGSQLRCSLLINLGVEVFF